MALLASTLKTLQQPQDFFFFLTHSSIDASTCFYNAEYVPYWLARELGEDVEEWAKTVHKSKFLAGHSKKMN